MARTTITLPTTSLVDGSLMWDATGAYLISDVRTHSDGAVSFDVTAEDGTYTGTGWTLEANEYVRLYRSV